MQQTFSIFVLLLALTPLASASPTTQSAGVSAIRACAGDSDVVITTTSRLAGSIHSLTWGGKEFINSTDHGRQLQSASSFDLGKYCPTPTNSETFNPTEAGSRDDGAGPTSTSRLLSLHAEGNTLHTTAQMAFWLHPGEKSAGFPARNTTLLSDHLLTKEVRIGYKNLPHAIQYDVTFTLPAKEEHHFAQFEALTGYMPPEFDHFWTFNVATGQLDALDAGPGEQPAPVVFSTADGKYAMGAFSPDQPAKGFSKSGYGRFKFEQAKVVKWNCVFRVRSEPEKLAGDYHFRIFVAVGDLEDVRGTIAALVQEFRK